MAHVPAYDDHWNTYAVYKPEPAPMPTLTVMENKRPIGYAPWPEEPKKTRKPRKATA